MASPTRNAVKAQRAMGDLVPKALHPLLRAFLYGYASSVGPRLLSWFLKHLRRRIRRGETTGAASKPSEPFVQGIFRILQGGLEWNRFPAFCAALVGGSTLLQGPIRSVLANLASGLSKHDRERATRALASFIAGWYSMKLLQTKHTDAYLEAPDAASPASGSASQRKRLAGRTLDLTLFAVCRAADVVVGELWNRHTMRRKAAGRYNSFDAFVGNLADPAVFAASCALIMWAWIYDNTRLPPAYNNWITAAAAVDHRLVLALRGVRSNAIIYGKNTNQADLLTSMCADYKWPLEWGDPEKTYPYPCEVVHMGVGPSCERHAMSRFIGGFKYALAMYLPLNMVLVVRKPGSKAIRQVVTSSVRSASFLGAFIMLYYYGICLARSRIGPLVVGTSTAAKQQLDAGICIGSGSALCGWSILLETPGRRKDIALFVAPRATATLLPRKYDLKHQWKETLAFALSCAVVATCLQENPARVRGVFGKLLTTTLGKKP